MAFPAYGTEWPSLSAYEFEFNGYAFGGTHSNALQLKKIEGLDMPTVRNGDSGSPRNHGLFVGLDVYGGREITLEGQLTRDSTSFHHAWEECAKATVAGGITQYPLFVNVPGYGTLATLARVRKRNMPIDIQFVLGELAEVTMLFDASDPRLYGETKHATVETPTRKGFKFNLKFNLKFGGGTYVDTLTINNEGNINTCPVFTVEGPCVNPSLTLGSAEGSPNLTFNVTLGAGEKLVIETDMHTATYYTGSGTQGSSRLYTLRAGSQWFTCPPGVNTVQFTAGTEEGTLSGEWASAWIL